MILFLILLLPFMVMGMEPLYKKAITVIDYNGKRFALDKQDHELLRKNCAAYDDYCTDPHYPNNTVVDWRASQPCMTQQNIIQLLYYLRPHHSIAELTRPKKLANLFYLARYLQVSKELERKLLLRCFEHINSPYIQPLCDDIESSARRSFSIREFLNTYHGPHLNCYDDLYPQPTSMRLEAVPDFEICSFQGISMLPQYCQINYLRILALPNHHITDFNLSEIVSVLPHLSMLNLCGNALTVLKRQHVQGLRPNFSLWLANNPITAIEKNFLTPAIIQAAPEAEICITYTRLTPMHIKALKKKYRKWQWEPVIAAQVTHGMVNLSLFIGVFAALDTMRGTRGGPIIGTTLLILPSLYFFFFMLQIFLGNHSLEKRGKPERPLWIIPLVTREGLIPCYSRSFVQCYAYSLHYESPWGFFSFKAG